MFFCRELKAVHWRKREDVQLTCKYLELLVSGELNRVVFGMIEQFTDIG